MQLHTNEVTHPCSFIPKELHAYLVTYLCSYTPVFYALLEVHIFIVKQWAMEQHDSYIFI
jgi:hypothetical protein